MLHFFVFQSDWRRIRYDEFFLNYGVFRVDESIGEKFFLHRKFDNSSRVHSIIDLFLIN